MANVVEILIKQSGQGNAISATAKELGGLDNAASNSIGVLGRFGSALGGMATIAAGILAANLFSKIAEGIGSFVSIGLDAVSSAQQLEVAFGALLTQNNLYQQTTETMTVAVGNLAEMQAEAANKSDDLAFAQRKLTADINTQNASIQEQRQRIIQMADGLDKNQQVARLAEMEVALEGMNRELADSITEQGKLSKVTQDYTTVTKTSWEQVMSLTDAQRLAKDQTKELLSFVEKLAIVSPFEQEDVERVTKYAVGAGLGVDVTKKFTTAFLDWSAAVGINSAGLSEAAYQLLQVKKAGTITAIDLKQLSTRGLDLAKVIGVEMGMSIEEFNAKAKESPAIFDDLIDAIVDYSNNTFAGTSEAMSTSIEGFKSTVSDLFTQSAKKVLRPLVDAITPTMSAMIGRAADFITGGGVEEIGQQLADVVMGGFEAASKSIGKVMGAFERFGVRGAAVSILGQLGLDQDQISGIMGVADQITGVIGKIQGAFERFGLKGAAVSILGMLGMDPETIGLIDTTITNISTTITEGFDKISGAYERFGLGGAGVSLLGQLGFEPETIAAISSAITTITEIISGISFEEIVGAFTGIGAVLAGGALAGLLVGIGIAIAGLLTPINFLIAGAALLGAAWAGNWGGIQEITATAFATITELFNQFMLIWNTNWPIIQAVALTAWEIIQGIMVGFQEALGPVIEQLTAQFTQIGIFLAGLGINWTTTWNAIVTATGIVAAGIGAAILGIIGIVAGLATGIAGGISASITLFQSLATTASEVFTSLTTIMTGWITTISALFSGDFAGAWEGFKTVLQGTADLVAAIWTGMISVATGTLGVLTATIGGFVDGIVGFFQGMYDSLVGNSIVPDLINDIVAWFKKLPGLVLNTLSTLASKIAEPFEDTWEGIKEAINIDEWSTLGTNAIEGLLEGMKEKAGEVLEFIKSLAMDSLSGLGQFWGSKSPATEFMPLGASVPQGIAVGINSAAGVATQAIQGMGRNLLTSTNSALSFIDDLDMGGLARGFGTGGGQWRNFRNILKNEIMGGMGALADGTANVMDSVYKVAARFNFPPGMAAEFAEANGLVEHLTGNFEKFRQQMNIENLGNMTQMAASFSGLGSTFADMLTQQMAGGEGAIKTMEAYNAALSKLITTEGTNQIAIDKKNLAIEKATETLGFGQRQMDIYAQELATLMLDEEGNALQIEKKVLQMDRLTESMDAQSKQLLTLQTELGKLTGDMEKNQAAVEATKKSYQALQAQAFDLFSGSQTEAQRVGSELATIALLEDFLRSGDSSFLIPSDAVSQAAGITGILYDQISGQAELNRLVAEQAEREALITEQKEAQQKLDFLKSQLDLLKLGQSLGGDIFQGITFGLNASVEDMLAAVNAVTMAMVDQIDHDLGIASPSKLLFDKFKNQIGGAMVGGLLAVKPMMEGAIQPILNPIMQGAQAAGRVVNNYFNQTVNTRAEQSSVIGDFRTMQLMAG